jgi:hypothetical protein
VDYCFARTNNSKNGNRNHNIQVSQSGKVIFLGMDCLNAVDYLRKHRVRIDCFVSLNEGLSEGGGYYAINSDMCLSYIMPILSDEYIHIMNKYYYDGHNYHVTMDLPYLITEISEGDQDYLDPFLFSDNEYHKGHAKVYRMKKQISVEKLNINPNIKISLIQDSIWNYTHELDLLVISITPQGQGDFFKGLRKVISIRDMSMEQILDYCVKKKVESIGLTPWAHGKYSTFIDQIKNRTMKYPKRISLFHLNRNDFKSMRELT